MSNFKKVFTMSAAYSLLHKGCPCTLYLLLCRHTFFCLIGTHVVCQSCEPTNCTSQRVYTCITATTIFVGISFHKCCKSWLDNDAVPQLQFQCLKFKVFHPILPGAFSDRTFVHKSECSPGTMHKQCQQMVKVIQQKRDPMANAPDFQL